jgi:hypothetical protein
MTGKIPWFHIPILSLLLLMTVIGAGPFYAASRDDSQRDQPTSAAGSTRQTSADITGTWSGTFFSRHSNVESFTMTVVIRPDSRGHLIGSSTLNSDCLRGAQLEVTVAGSKVQLAGSDEEGDNLTVRGTLDKAGTLLQSTYILNGSATGRCETDDGTGNLVKR